MINITKEFELSDEGVVSFFLKDGDDGGKKCVASVNKMKKKAAEEAKKAAVALRRKEEALRRIEEIQRKKCISKGPRGSGCSRHSRGKYVSKCNRKHGGVIKHGAPFNPSCTCECNEGWVGSRCHIQFKQGSCRSVGTSSTADGVFYNIYDAGEFIYFEHQMRSEVHVLRRMAHPRISATAAVAVKVCEKKKKFGSSRGKCDIISLEAGNCRNGNRVNVRASENGKYNTRSLYGKNYQTKNTKVKFNGRNTITGPGVRMFTPGFWRYGWYHHQKGAGGCNRGGRCRSWNGCGNYGGYLNAYLTFKAPRDGRTKGTCGQFSGNRRRDSIMIAQSGRRNQWGRTMRDRYSVKAKDSFFKCGQVYDYAYNGHHIASNQV